MVHQFCRVGVHAFVAGGSIVLRDVPPYVMGGGSTSAEPHGINSEGLKRRGFSAAAIESIRRAYKTLYRSGLGFEEAKQAIAEQARETPELQVHGGFPRLERPAGSSGKRPWRGAAVRRGPGASPWWRARHRATSSGRTWSRR